MPESPILQKTVKLEPNWEWASDPFRLDEGQVVELDAVGTMRAYLTLVPSDYYDTHAHAPKGTFPFDFGTDRSSHLQTIKVPKTAYYRVVARNSIFNETGTIRIEVKPVE